MSASGSAHNVPPGDHHRTGTHSSANQNHQHSNVRGGVGAIATPATQYPNGFGPRTKGHGGSGKETAQRRVSLSGMTGMVKDFFGKGASGTGQGSGNT